MQVYSIDCLSEYYNFLYVRADNMCRFSIVWMRGVVYVCMHMVALTCIHIWRVYISGVYMIVHTYIYYFWNCVVEGDVYNSICT